jgi:hypothetical protein
MIATINKIEAKAKIAIEISSLNGGISLIKNRWRTRNNPITNI